MKGQQKMENTDKDRSFYNIAHQILEEPELNQSDSSDSKYSNEDREDKDHLMIGKEAIKRSMHKLKNAARIMEKNELLNKNKNISHLVAYFDEVNKKELIPKPLGMVRRKNPVNVIDVHDQVIKNKNADAFANAIHRAKYVNVLNLRNTSLTDETAIQII